MVLKVDFTTLSGTERKPKDPYRHARGDRQRGRTDGWIPPYMRWEIHGVFEAYVSGLRCGAEPSHATN